MEWQIPVRYGNSLFRLKAEIEYHSNQVMRIRVHGSKSTLLLENNYPLIRLTSSKKGIHWKIREGVLSGDPVQNSQLLQTIMTFLEKEIKKEFPI